MSAMWWFLEGPVMAGWVSPLKAALWHSSSQNPVWADRPLWRKLADRLGRT
jgi:hypothetical protein